MKRWNVTEKPSAVSETAKLKMKESGCQGRKERREKQVEMVKLYIYVTLCYFISCSKFFRVNFGNV